MSGFYIFLFGKFTIESEAAALITLDGSKVQELFSYLLLHRNRPHPRETLATLLWDGIPASQSKGYLRKALWQLQSALDGSKNAVSADFLLVEAEWIQLNTGRSLWLDVAQFERAFERAQDVTGYALDPRIGQEMSEAVRLYRSDLLEGWYQEWCLFERERLQQMYLIMLEKLMHYYEGQEKYETGLAYGMEVLRYDHARERTHRRLMRLHYLVGNRSEALRQYGRCVAILQKELGVEPAARTMALYRQILADRLSNENGVVLTAAPPAASSLHAVLQHLEALQHQLSETQHQIEHDIEIVEKVLNSLHAP